MDWSIQFCYDKKLNPAFIYDFFHFLVTKGVKYNVGMYEGSYSILTGDPKKDVEHTEKEIKESTYKIDEIIDNYLKFDLTTTHFSIGLNYTGEVNFDFWIYIIPDSIPDSKYLISFESNDHCIHDEKPFLSFVNLCKEAFIKYNFVYGAFRNEYQGYINCQEDFLKVPPDVVCFYSKQLADKIGIEKLLSAPVRTSERLENGGIMMLICILRPNELGCSNTHDVWRHLGYE